MDKVNNKIYYIVGSCGFAAHKFHPSQSDTVIAADGGYASVGSRANYAVGDWDSLGGKPQDIACVSLPTRKDLTDMGYAIQLALRGGADEIRLFGADGGRIDHYLANLQYAVYIAGMGVKCTIYCADCNIYACHIGTATIKGRKGATMSFIPMQENTCVSLSGVEYPLDNHTMPYDNPGLGVSNVIDKDIADITVHSGAGLIILYD